MNIIITGEKSYIGTNLKNWLLCKNEGLNIRMLSMRGSGWEVESFKDTDCIIHLSAIVHKKETKENRREFTEVNLELTKKLAEKAVRENVPHFIFMSTMAVYGLKDSFKDNNVIDKNTPLNPKTAYGESKLSAEIYIRELMSEKFTVDIIRAPMVYGSGCAGNYALLRKLVLKLRMVPKITNTRSMIYINNLCELIYLIIKNKEGEVYTPQNEDYVNTCELALKIAAQNNISVKTTPVFNFFIRRSIFFTNKFVKAFGNLCYSKDISKHFDNAYCITTFEQSVKESEN